MRIIHESDNKYCNAGNCNCTELRAALKARDEALENVCSSLSELISLIKNGNTAFVVRTDGECSDESFALKAVRVANERLAQVQALRGK